MLRLGMVLVFLQLSCAANSKRNDVRSDLSTKAEEVGDVEVNKIFSEFSDYFTKSENPVETQFYCADLCYARARVSAPLFNTKYWGPVGYIQIKPEPGSIWFNAGFESYHVALVLKSNEGKIRVADTILGKIESLIGWASYGGINDIDSKFFKFLGLHERPQKAMIDKDLISLGDVFDRAGSEASTSKSAFFELVPELTDNEALIYLVKTQELPSMHEIWSKSLYELIRYKKIVQDSVTSNPQVLKEEITKMHNQIIEEIVERQGEKPFLNMLFGEFSEATDKVATWMSGC